MTIRSLQKSCHTLYPAACAMALMVCVAYGMPQARPATATPDLTGVYQAIPQGATFPGGLKNSGGPSEIALQPAAAQQTKHVDLKEDASKLCLPVGPFRMMARERVKIELFPGPGTMVMLFEDISHGHVRTI